MKDLNTREWNNSIKHSCSLPHDFFQAANEICEKALNDARRQLHPLLRNVELGRLEQRGEFLQAYKCALEKRIARKLAAWQPDVQAVFHFEERRITDIDNWDGSIHLLVKVARLSNTVEALGKELDHGLVRYLTQVGWQRFGMRQSILDVQQVTMSELRHAVGYGAMFCAVYTAPVQIWP
jgi:hypothetical protein